MTTSITRRNLIATTLGAAVTVACSRPLARRYAGWLLVASATEKGITVADLAQFRRVTTIQLGEIPAQILRVGDKAFVTCPDARLLVELDLARFTPGKKLAMPGSVVAAVLVPESGLIVVATAQPAMLVVVDPKAFRITRRVSLPTDPAALDVSGNTAAVAARLNDALTRVSLRDGAVLGSSALGEPCGSMRFRNDGKSILAGLPRSRQIVSLDVATGAILARLPLRFSPGRFCFNADGGQMFVTAPAEDAVVIVSPYQSQIDQTIVAGRTPWGMAVSPVRNLLLITNPASGDLTILDIETRRLAASVHVGGEPGDVLLTPDEEYALVVDRHGGEVAVIRMKTVLDKAVRTKPLLTMFPMGAAPQSALIIPRDA